MSSGFLQNGATIWVILLNFQEVQKVEKCINTIKCLYTNFYYTQNMFWRPLGLHGIVTCSLRETLISEHAGVQDSKLLLFAAVGNTLVVLFASCVFGLTVASACVF